MRTMLLSKAAKSSRVSSRHCRCDSNCCCFSASWAAAASSAAEASGGGVGGSVGGTAVREVGAKRRLVMRLKGFSSTFRRRDLWKESVQLLGIVYHVISEAFHTFFRLV